MEWFGVHNGVIDEFLKSYLDEKSELGKKLKVTGTVNQIIKNDELKEAIKLVRKALEKDL
jgi:hypothetical protein